MGKNDVWFLQFQPWNAPALYRLCLSLFLLSDDQKLSQLS